MSQIQQKRVRSIKLDIEWKMREMHYRLVRGEKDTNIMHSLLLTERNYYKYKQKLSKKIEKYQLEKCDITIWLEVQH
ncbi:MAG: hypothetical protein AB7P56_03865 [Nitrososphaeraceae archaeon]